MYYRFLISLEKGVCDIQHTKYIQYVTSIHKVSEFCQKMTGKIREFFSVLLTTVIAFI